MSGTEGLRVVGLAVYPVKSLAGVRVDGAPLDRRGLTGDRRWAVVDEHGAKVTAREEHALLGLRAEPLADGAVRLVAPGVDPVVAQPPREADPVAVVFSGQDLARSAGEGPDTWLSDRVGRPLRLVWQDDETRRPIRPDLGGEPGDTNSLSDAAPIHVTTEESLQRLGDWLVETAASRGEEPPEPLGHERFRPNVVISGGEPFAEDDWRDVTIGAVPFRATMVCDRCVMTTIDRDTLESGKEPIRTLARHRRWEGATWFGIRLTPVLPLAPDAMLHVGDPVVVTRSASS